MCIDILITTLSVDVPFLIKCIQFIGLFLSLCSHWEIYHIAEAERDGFYARFPCNKRRVCMVNKTGHSCHVHSFKLVSNVIVTSYYVFISSEPFQATFPYSYFGNCSLCFLYTLKVTHDTPSILSSCMASLFTP